MWLWSLSWLIPAAVTGQSQTEGLQEVKRAQPLLGTYVTITVYATDSMRAHKAMSSAFEAISRVDSMMSLHQPGSELNRLNEHAADQPFKASEELFEVISIGQRIARRTDGAFDPTVRPLTRLWGFIWKEYRLPTDAELKRVLPKVGYKLMALDPDDRTVRFRRDGVSLDLGGIGKGYAVDKAIETLRDEGIDRAMVKAGGDLRVIGLPPNRDAWHVHLEDPQKRGRRVTIPFKSGALSTSGNYENYFVVEGKRYSHLIDPRTGKPVRGVAACSLLAPTATLSDAWASACFVYGPKASLKAFGERFAMRLTLMPEDPNIPLEQWSVLKTESFPETIEPED